MKNKIYYPIIAIIFILILSAPVNAGWWSNIFKISDEGKTVSNTLIKTEKKAQMTINQENGLKWESTAQKGICGVVGGCLSTFAAASKRLRWSNGIEETFIIYGGKATKQFINEKRLYRPWSSKTFTKEPDFLEVKQVNRRITGITIIDAKATKQAARADQEAAFLELCQYSPVPCKVDYVVPKSSLSQSDSAFLCLATIPITLTGPVGILIEGMCFLAAV